MEIKLLDSQKTLVNSIHKLLRFSKRAKSQSKKEKVLTGELQKLLHLLLLLTKAITFVSQDKTLNAVPFLIDTLMYSTKKKTVTTAPLKQLLVIKLKLETSFVAVPIFPNLQFSVSNTVMPKQIPTHFVFGKLNLVTSQMALRS